MNPEVWDQRYSAAEFAYGEAPNVFIAQAARKYLVSPQQPPLFVVELASGEGRNVVALADMGHRVAAVDFSQAGLDKTKALAEKRGCPQGSIEYHLGDVCTWQPEQGPGSVDAVVMSFCHIPSDLKPGFVTNLRSMLKPGGLLLLECFQPDQIHKGYREKSGGPHDPTMMWQLQELRGLLSAHGEELDGCEVEYELHEGKLHEGMGAVVRYVWRKK